MAIIKAFACIRPKKDLASRIAALPYDVFSREEAEAEVKKEPYSFLKIDRAETQLEASVDMYDTMVYQKASDTLWDMVEKGEFLKDQKKNYYLYRLVMDGRSQTGIVACASIDDYQNNVIKKHENTREDKEQDRIRHVDLCNAQTGPIFLTYRSNAVINQIVADIQNMEADYDFITEDQVRHTVWKVADENMITVISDAFSRVSDIYIADGHHRAAAAVKVGFKRRAERPDYTGQEEFNFFLSVLFPDDQLMILPYNRVVKDLNGDSKATFLREIEGSFLLERLGSTPFSPDRKGCFGMYLEGEWYKLTAKQELLSSDPVLGLDVSILQNALLEPVLNIKDPRVDKRIDFIGGIRGLEELKRRADTDMKVAFSMYPTSIAELLAVADANLLMPPKSTWFEPKLRSGLFIHSLAE